MLTSHRDLSVEDVDARGHVLNEPVEALKQPVAGDGAAADDPPVPALVHGRQIQDLQNPNHTNGPTKSQQDSGDRTCTAAATGNY